MRQQNAIFVLSALILVGCYPKYVGQPQIAERAAMVVEAEPIGIAVVEMRSPDQCISGEGSAQVLAQWIPLDERFSDVDESRTIECTLLSPLTPEDVYMQIEPARARTPNVSPSVPILKRAPGRGAYYRFGRSSLFVSSDSKSVLVVYGSYGNREGLESEHIYSVKRNGAISILRTEKLVEYNVQLEMLSEF